MYSLPPQRSSRLPSATHAEYRSTTFESSASDTSSGTGVALSQSRAASIGSRNQAMPASDYLHGVNVGGWLILERYLDNGSIFARAFSGSQVKDQWSFDSLSGSDIALVRHWSTYFTEADVQPLRSYGFNALRIPIGFWAFDNRGYQLRGQGHPLGSLGRCEGSY